MKDVLGLPDHVLVSNSELTVNFPLKLDVELSKYLDHLSKDSGLSKQKVIYYLLRKLMAEGKKDAVKASASAPVYKSNNPHNDPI